MNKRHIGFAVLCCAFLMCSSFAIGQAGGDSSGAQAPSSTGSMSMAPMAMMADAQGARRVTAYTLPPDLAKKAHEKSQISFRLQLIGFVYGLVVLWIILRGKLGPKYRDWAERASRVRFVQALVYSPLLILTMAVLGLPLDVYSETIEKKYGISVQAWGSWFGDWLKGQMVAIVIFTILIWLLYAVIRKSPRLWWFYFWLLSIPILLFVFFLSPWVIAPLFNKFEPLQQKDAPLTASLERMVQRAGQDIPPERMFWMGAAEKTNALNAYVTGFGASKRIVVYDTTIAKMNSQQIVFVAGHEMGHYVLRHIPKLISFSAVLFLLLFYLAYRLIGGMLARWGSGWAIRGVDDWASLPALLFLLSVFLFVLNPLTNGFSRYVEHQADQYGLEVTHGLTPDSGQVAAQAFQVLGEVDLADPDPGALDVFLFYNHPSIPERVQYSLHYDPWANGGAGEFVK